MLEAAVKGNLGSRKSSKIMHLLPMQILGLTHQARCIIVCNSKFRRDRSVFFPLICASRDIVMYANFFATCKLY